MQIFSDVIIDGRKFELFGCFAVYEKCYYLVSFFIHSFLQVFKVFFVLRLLSISNNKILLLITKIWIDISKYYNIKYVLCPFVPRCSSVQSSLDKHHSKTQSEQKVVTFLNNIMSHVSISDQQVQWN